MNSKELSKKVFEQIRDNYVYLKSLWDTYRIIFEDYQNIKIAQKTAETFFHDLNIMLIDQIILNSCTLTDNYNNKNKNLVLGYFMEIDEFKNDSSMIKIYNSITSFRNDYIKKARDKIIAHNDFNTSINMTTLGEFPKGDDELFFKNIEKFLNIISKAISGEIMGEISTSCIGDITDLMRYLKYGINMEKMLNDTKTLDGKIKIDKYMNMKI